MPIKLTSEMDSVAPVRTEAGAQELRARTLGLTQKVRTVLLLVDGKRTFAEVRKLMGGAGVAPESLQQLLDLNLIDVTAESLAAARVLAAPPAARVKQSVADILGDAPPDPPSTMTAINLAYEPYIDPNRNIDNLTQNTMAAVFGQIGTPSSEPMSMPLELVKDADPALSAARSHLTQALSAMVPADSAALMFRIGRCNTRAEMTELLREVEVKIARRGRVNEAAEIVRHARALLMA